MAMEVHLDSVRLTRGYELQGEMTKEQRITRPRHFGVAVGVGVFHPRFDLQPASWKDSRPERGGAGRGIARMTSSAGTCRARGCSDSVDWASYEWICHPDAISRRGSQASIDSCPKIQGMTAGSFL
jgi:hypothetical protein